MIHPRLLSFLPARHKGSAILVCLALLIGLCPACSPTEDVIATPSEVAQGTSGAGGEGHSEVGCIGPSTQEEGVVALYTFDDDDGRTRVTDLVGGHIGSVQLGMVSTVEGPEDCGRAFDVTEGDQYFVVDDSPDWDLEEGSVDLWLWLPIDLTDNVGLLSRDLIYREEAGHLSLFVDSEGRAVARVQPIEDGAEDNSADAVSCTGVAVPRETWFHIGVNFGPPGLELYVDGVLSDWGGETPLDDDWQCGQSGIWGIAGNDLPWVIGRSTYQSDEVLGELELPATGAAIDHLRISRVRREFASFF